MATSNVQDPELIAGLYEAAANPAQWPSAWARLCRAFGAETGLLYRKDYAGAPPRIVASTNWDATALRVYSEYYVQMDPFGRAIDRANAYRSFTGQDIVAPDMLAESAIYRDFAIPYLGGAFHVVAASLVAAGEGRTGMGFARPFDAKPYTQVDRTALDEAALHVTAALRLERQLTDERLASASRGAALDQLTHGAVIVDATGTILFANDAALQFAADGGLVLGAPGEGLTCENPAEADRLTRLIVNAAHGGAAGSTRVTRPGRMPILAAIVSPLPLPLGVAVGVPPGADRRLALVIVRDLGATSDAAQSQLMELFSLTGAEAAIVPQLIAGESASLIAQSRGVAVATIRAQAARVLAKTGAANLRALASMIAALGAG
jgi:DNA-binding CsgD family transcriptional regulator/PAS domain-containing protein